MYQEGFYGYISELKQKETTMVDVISNAIDSTVKKLNNTNGSLYTGMKTAVREAVEYFHIAMFPDYIGQDSSICRACSTTDTCTTRPVTQRMEEAFQEGANRLVRCMCFVMPFKKACECTAQFIDKIPEVQILLNTDIDAAYEGDPAATCRDEVILAYPAFRAIGIYRLAHVLFLMNIPIVPRMMTEYAHELTGIDIHPGATIGSHFFIDHGTGVVIGETTTIGNHVKIYQHVTLGAKSLKAMVKGIKRHPDIGDNVVIYAGATILGGDVRIGNNSVIGGNVWLTHSVDANTSVMSSPAENRQRSLL